MHKLIQSIALTTVLCSPLALISFVTSAEAHHTSSHVSTVAIQTTNPRKPKTNNTKKAVANITHRQKK